MRYKSSFTFVMFLALFGATLCLRVAQGQEAAAAGAASRKPKTKVAPVYPTLARQMNDQKANMKWVSLLVAPADDKFGELGAAAQGR